MRDRFSTPKSAYRLSMADTLAQPARHESVIRNSRFIALAERQESEHGMRTFIDRIRETGANHHCWAWKSGQLYRFDDDGEPGGTAGRPILQAIEGQDMDQVGVVVIRYFGGIKLGTGGLARAYGGTAAECLRLAEREALVDMSSAQVTLDFEHADRAHQLFARHQAQKLAECYDENGVCFDIELPSQKLKALKRDLDELSRGRVELTLTNQ